MDKNFWATITIAIFVSCLFGIFSAKLVSFHLFDIHFREQPTEIRDNEGEEMIKKNLYYKVISQEEAVIQIVEKASVSVVNIIATRDLPVVRSPFEQFFGNELQQKETERREVGWGSGFIVSENGLILTNRHVVEDEKADYTVVLPDGREFPAKIVDRDRIHDLAIIQIEAEELLPVVELGNSDNLRVGQTVIAIGNMLGEFQNSVSVGVVSGLGRTITARGGGFIMRMEDVIQTDAAINRGNSGGPLLNLQGQVIGINTAMVIGVENIGFAIPVNIAQEAVIEVKEYGRIKHPFLGVRWLAVTGEIQKRYNLTIDYGALIIKGDRGQSAIFPSSAAEKAGLAEGDVILKVNQDKITLEKSLAKIIMKYEPGDSVFLKILRDGEEKMIELILGEK